MQWMLSNFSYDFILCYQHDCLLLQMAETNMHLIETFKPVDQIGRFENLMKKANFITLSFSKQNVVLHVASMYC